jgi:hypothetical protein
MNPLRFANKSLVLLGLLALATPLIAADKTGQAAALDAKAPTLIQMLTWAIQDEWAARAEYQVVLSKWNKVRPFANIIKAEENHIAWLTPLFGKNGLPVPVEPKPSTVIPTDWTKALALGAQAEVLNIAMYDKFLKQALPDDVRAVFEELKRGSENHLRAFQGGGGNGGGL